MQQLALSY